MLAMLVHFMRGTPYVYQGEEIGTPNAGFTSIEQYEDVESKNYYNILQSQGKSADEALEILRERSRDNGRTPMMWNDKAGRGFTTGTPWLSFPIRGADICVENQKKEADSVLQFYRRCIAMRKANPVISDGEIRFLDTPDGTIGYSRSLGEKRLVVICNLTDQSVILDASMLEGLEYTLGSYGAREEKSMELRAFEGCLWEK